MCSSTAPHVVHQHPPAEVADLMLSMFAYQVRWCVWVGVCGWVCGCVEVSISVSVSVSICCAEVADGISSCLRTCVPGVFVCTCVYGAAVAHLILSVFAFQVCSCVCASVCVCVLNSLITYYLRLRTRCVCVCDCVCVRVLDSLISCYPCLRTRCVGVCVRV